MGGESSDAFPHPSPRSPEGGGEGGGPRRGGGRGEHVSKDGGSSCRSCRQDVCTCNGLVPTKGGRKRRRPNTSAASGAAEQLSQGEMWRENEMRDLGECDIVYYIGLPTIQKGFCTGPCIQ